LLKKGSGSCQAGYLNKEKFERLVINRIKELILTEENLRELARLVNEEMDSTSGKLTKELGIISDEITGTADRLERLYDALETGKIGIDDLAPRIRQLRMKHELLQTRKRELEISLSDRRGELADMKAVTECVEELRGLLEESDLTERKAFIRSFVREVKVTGTEVLLTYTTPIPPDKISRDMQRVLYSVHPSGPSGTIGKTGIVSVGGGSSGGTGIV
jgi:site-specific DNA recombinase